MEGKPGLIELVERYETPDEARELVSEYPPALLVGISWAGKDTTKRHLLATGEYSEVISHTTRLPRMNNGELEQDGVHYHFVSRDFMYNMVRWGKFIEVKPVHTDAPNGGEVYGTSIAEFTRARTLGKIALTDLDVKGVREYKKLSDRTVAIFILPPDYETWLERGRGRYVTEAEFEAERPKRSKTAILELEEALALPYYHFIINDDIGRTVQVADEIAHRGDVFKRGDDEARLAARDLLAEIKEHVPGNNLDVTA